VTQKSKRTHKSVTILSKNTESSFRISEDLLQYTNVSDEDNFHLKTSDFLSEERSNISITSSGLIGLKVQISNINLLSNILLY